MAYLASQFKIPIHLDRKSLAARTGGFWSHCTPTPEADTNANKQLAFFLVYSSDTPVHGILLPILGWTFPPYLTSTGNFFTDKPEVSLLRFSTFCHVILYNISHTVNSFQCFKTTFILAKL